MGHRAACFTMAGVAFASLAIVAPMTGKAVAAGDPARLASVEVTAAPTARATSVQGVVEAVRQTVLAAQVPGAVVALPVRAGERVKAGQPLVRLDARAAQQQAGAAAAQVQAARAAQDAATREYERQRQLYEQRYISQAALDRAEAQFRSTRAQAAAQLASAGAARTETGFYAVKAPYDAIVAEVGVVLGDLAMPGRPLLTLYDPAAMRVAATVPESTALALGAWRDAVPQVELGDRAGAALVPLRWELLPSADPATHTMQLRLELPPGVAATPGRYARVLLPALPSMPGAAARLAVPLQAVVRRAELVGVYVLGADDRPLLRQVRLGPVDGGRVEELTGLALGERVALDPQAAARVR